MRLDDLGTSLTQRRFEDRDPRMGHPVVAAEQADAERRMVGRVSGRAHDWPILYSRSADPASPPPRGPVGGWRDTERQGVEGP
jgi:hypothetical protein